MAYEINKLKMKNDIVLTSALLFSLILVRFVMNITGLTMSDYHTPIFFVSSFICIKGTYNLFSKIADKLNQLKKNL